VYFKIKLSILIDNENKITEQQTVKTIEVSIASFISLHIKMYFIKEYNKLINILIRICGLKNGFSQSIIEFKHIFAA